MVEGLMITEMEEGVMAEEMAEMVEMANGVIDGMREQTAAMTVSLTVTISDLADPIERTITEMLDDEKWIEEDQTIGTQVAVATGLVGQIATVEVMKGIAKWAVLEKIKAMSEGKVKRIEIIQTSPNRLPLHLGR